MYNLCMFTHILDLSRYDHEVTACIGRCQAINGNREHGHVMCEEHAMVIF